MSVQIGINLSVLKRRALRTIQVYSVLSVLCGILYWILNPIGAKDITQYMMTEGIPNWGSHSILNMLWIWIVLSMVERRK